MTLAEEFARTQGRPIYVGGRAVVPMLKHEVHMGDRVRVTWRRSIDAPVQGIRIKVHGGTLAIDGNDFADVVLWRDTAPHEAVIVCNVKRSAELRVWNCWRDDRGVMQAWVGNAGMRIQKVADDSFTAECNSRPAITFEDVVFDLVVEHVHK